MILLTSEVREVVPIPRCVSAAERSSVDKVLTPTILGVMFDPAILHDFQRAMVPPSLPPLAIVREWVSPQTEHRKAVIRTLLAAAEVQLHGWHGKVDRQLAGFSQLEHIVWDDSDRALFDHLISNTEANADATARNVERQHRRELRNNARITKLDPTAAREQRAFLDKVHGWQRDNVEKMLDVALHLRAIRAKHDGRSTIVGSFDNPDDLATFLEAAIAA